MAEPVEVVELSHVSKRFGDVVALEDCSFTLADNQVISLLGPSGCGKTTTLRLIAGFEDPDEGEIRISGQDMRGTRPYERNVGLLFQDYALFPHMTVEDNVSYGLRRRSWPRAEIPRRTQQMLELVKLTGYEKRWPQQLSGGQQQRVALARALATDPQVILLDEPLSALDAKLRQELRIELKEILRAVGSSAIVVTHDQEEAMSLADHIIVMNEGRIVQTGNADDIYVSPKTKFVAEFVGRSNWFSGVIEPDDSPLRSRFVMTGDRVLLVPRPSADIARTCEVCVRPERIRMAEANRTPADLEDGLNILRGTVVDLAPLGADVHIVVELPTGQRVSVLEKNSGRNTTVRPGQEVELRFEWDSCIVVPAGS